MIKACPVIEELYADLALVFHWTPSEIDKLDLAEILMFREMARVRHQGKSAE